jgi:hypothetical protein
MSTIIDLIIRLLGGFVDAFKVKNPVVFTIIITTLGIIYYSLGSLIDAVLPGGGSLLPEATEAIIETIRNILVAVMAVLGAHTPEQKPPNVPESAKALEHKFS